MNAIVCTCDSCATINSCHVHHFFTFNANNVTILKKLFLKNIFQLHRITSNEHDNNKNNKLYDNRGASFK